MSTLRPAIVLMALLILLTGLAYPLGLTAISQAVMPAKANGSLITKGDGTVIGSALIGQNFADDKYWWPRPSPTSAADPNDATKTVDAPYNAANSSGANLGPTSAKLAERLNGDVKKLRDTGITGPIPADAVTTSGSGLDPDISPEFALAQVPRVAKARGVTEDRLRDLVGQTTAGRTLGIFGEPTVNVLKLNMALDALKS